MVNCEIKNIHKYWKPINITILEIFSSIIDPEFSYSLIKKSTFYLSKESLVHQKLISPPPLWMNILQQEMLLMKFLVDFL